MKTFMKKSALALAVASVSFGALASEPIIVTEDNYAFAMLDHAMQVEVSNGAANDWHHHRSPMTLDKQPAPQMNRDTLYSFAIVDARSDFSITLPETDGRYQSIHVMEHDHTTSGVLYGAGEHVIKGAATSDYLVINVRTQINPNDPDDIALANHYQDQLILDFKGADVVPFEFSNWDKASFNKLHTKYVKIATEEGVNHTMGARGQYSTYDVNRGASTTTGLLPDADAVYEMDKYSLDVNSCYQATYAVPGQADADLGFFSATIYGDDQYLHNEVGSSISNQELAFNEDGTFTIYYGNTNTCGKVDNLLIVPTDDVYLNMRIYMPDASVQAGEYKLPVPMLVK